ncbi:hypothetical protein [Streptomyces sp. ST2-7A]|uniref:hypothetical protein n=1 Tax=Streptomyces sp. ST2-7A TaxID=2907214 RepID=UPI001F25C604|nr:hypothetical protein [Streptomyces sp. ST2-7A]MCE7082806.1 hypothetical protein [Streptomyces sp. ST2-7A]
MGSWLRLFGAELRRTLPRLLPVGLLVLLVTGAVFQARAVQDVAHSNLDQVRTGMAHLTPEGCAEDTAGLPPDAGVSPEVFHRECVENLPRTIEMYRNIEVGFTATAEHLAPAQHPVGTVGASFGWLATVPGLVAIILLAAYFTAGEWSRGTVVPLLLHEQRLWRLLSAKTAVLLVWSLLTAAVMSLALWALAALHTRRAHPLHDMVSDAEVRAYTLQRAGVGLLVLAITCVASVALAAALRSPLRSSLAGVLLLGLVTLPITAWSPGAILADGLELKPYLNAWDHVWTTPLGTSVPASIRALPWVVLLLGVVWHGWRVRPRSLV